MEYRDALTGVLLYRSPDGPWNPETVPQHYPGCTPNYPEKPEGEPPQPVMRIDLGDGEWVDQCGDCGAILRGEFKNMPHGVRVEADGTVDVF